MSDEMSEEMSDKMSDVGPCRSFKCIVELDESAVNEAFAPEAMCLFMKTFESSDLDPELFICFNVCKGPNSVRNLSISITNRSKSEFEIVSFNGSRINGGNLSLKPNNGAVVWNNDEDWPFFKIDDYIDPVSNQWRMEVNIEVALPTSDSIESLRRMMNDIEFHDTVLVSRDGEMFPVHRNILAARSRVFKDMFLQDKFVRGKTSRADVDLNGRELNELVNFCYTNAFASNTADFLELARTADYYEIVGFRKECDVVLLHNLNENDPEKAFDILVRRCPLRSDPIKSAMAYMGAFDRSVRTTPDSSLYYDVLSNVDKMRKEGEFTDAVLISRDGHEVSVHRNIVAMRSEVFRAMLPKDKFKEGKSGRVHIDLDGQTLDEFVCFIYTNKFDSNSADVLDMFTAADYYDLSGLVDNCEAVLIENLNADNVAEALARSMHLQKAGLKDAASAFIVANFRQVRETPGWAELRKTPFAIEACEDIMMKNSAVQE